MTAPLPPPPPAEPRRAPGWLPWALVALAAAAVAVTAVLVAARGPGTPAAGTTSTTAPSATTATTSTTTTLPSTTTTVAATTTVTAATTTTPPITTLPAHPPYPDAALAYFREVAGLVEFGGGGGVIHRWERDVLIEVAGNPGPGDLAALDDVIADLNEILDPIEVSLVGDGGTIELTFAPQEDFPSLEPNYQPGNLGFVWIWWDGRGAVTSAHVLISTTGTDGADRAHLLREEITQSLGLLNDSWQYEDSIFYQGWTTVQDYSPIDVTVIEMLYRPEIGPGMGIDDAVAVLAALGG